MNNNLMLAHAHSYYYMLTKENEYFHNLSFLDNL